MRETNEQSLIQRDGETPAVYLGDTLLMMSVDHGQYFRLNEIGSRIWELLEKPTTSAKLVDQLVSEYEVSPDDCAREVAIFLKTLQDRKLLTDIDPSCA